MASSGKTAEREVRPLPFGAPYAFVLTVVDGDDPTLSHRLRRRETIVGRDPEADLVLDDPTVSNVHCKLRVEGAVCTLLDLDSLNGTRVNGRPLRAHTGQRLRHLDEVEIGSVRLLVLSGRFRASDPQRTANAR